MRACALLIIAGSTDHAGHTKEEMDYVLRRATNRLLVLACLPACLPIEPWIRFIRPII